MIERKNIIKLLNERTKSNVYHSAILTCYNFDSIFFESVYLPSLRSLGVTNIIVLMDASMYDSMLADASYVCHRVSPINYTLVRQENLHHGVFHSKITLLFGEDEGVLVIGSGNLTFSGLSNNEEVWNAFHVKGNESVHFPLLLKTWNYLREALKDSPSLVKKQLGWIPEQSIWLQDIGYEDVVRLDTGEQCSVVYNNTTSRIFDQVVDAIGDSVVEEITVIAPFYDAEGNALTELKKRFNPTRMNCVLDLDRQSAPYELLKSNTDIVFFKHSAPNPLHAKIIEFHSNNGTWLLSGSANAGNMALGLNSIVYNDEICVLLHSLERKSYVSELGIQYDQLDEDDRKSIERPKQDPSEPSTITTTLKACEEKDGKLYLHFSNNGIKGFAVILDKEQEIIYKEEIVSDNTVELLMDESLLSKSHIAVLIDNEMNLSNRCLIIKELHIESCNPDPKRRKLSSLLDDNSLLQNLTHILGYVEFDENDKKTKSARLSTRLSSKDKEDVVVAQDRFNELKDSSLSISMHSGVRILAYLQQILFKKDDTETSDDDLLEIDKDENGNDDDQENPNYDHQKIEASSAADDANKMRIDIVNFLKKMQQYLLSMTEDISIHGEVNKAVNRPKLIAVPGLNASSSIAVATRAVVVLMNKYGSNVIKRTELRELLVSCAGLFFSLYANSIPDDNSNRSRKIRELVKDASVDLLSALSFFDFGKKDISLPPVVLNCLDLWKDKEELHLIVPLYEEQLSKLNIEDIHKKTVDRILFIANNYLEGDAPIREFSRYDEVVYLYRKGYGFLLVDNIKLSSGSLSYEYHGSWFDDKLTSNATRYKGYKDL
jgi:hypothetical protein